jgi:hypothetical protein
MKPQTAIGAGDRHVLHTETVELGDQRPLRASDKRRDVLR